MQGTPAAEWTTSPGGEPSKPQGAARRETVPGIQPRAPVPGGITRKSETDSWGTRGGGARGAPPPLPAVSPPSRPWKQRRNEAGSAVGEGVALTILNPPEVGNIL